MEPIAAAPDAMTDEEAEWLDRSIDDVINYVLAHYHAPLPFELDRLLALATEMANREGRREDSPLPAIRDTVGILRLELLLHLHKEQAILFPRLRDGDPRTETPVARMLADHEAAVRMLAQLSVLTDGHTAPRDACAALRTLYEGLEELEQTLVACMNFEQRVVFKHAIALPQEVD